jgi:hypothetical protein
MMPKTIKLYHCEECDYSSNKKCNYLKHLETRKHQNIDKILPEKEWKCECNKPFRFRQSYYRHRKRCKIFTSFQEKKKTDELGVSCDMKSLIHELRANSEEVNKLLVHFKEIIPLVDNTKCNTDTNQSR